MAEKYGISIQLELNCGAPCSLLIDKYIKDKFFHTLHSMWISFTNLHSFIEVMGSSETLH